MLTEAETKKPIRRINWLYVAAAILGFMTLATLAFRDWKNERHEVVGNERPPVEKREAPQMQVMQEPVPQTRIAVEERAPATENSIATPRPNERDQGHRNAVSPASVSPASVPQMQQVAVENESVKTENKPNRQSTSEIPVTPQADVQLADAGNISPKPVKVDAHALLSQVDGELDQSFREKVLSGVSKKYQDVKVALANRNRE
jgi:hypothetical protein